MSATVTLQATLHTKCAHIFINNLHTKDPKVHCHHTESQNFPWHSCHFVIAHLETMAINSAYFQIYIFYTMDHFVTLSEVVVMVVTPK